MVKIDMTACSKTSIAIPETKEPMPQKSKTNTDLSFFMKIAKMPGINDNIPLTTAPNMLILRSTWIWIDPDLCSPNIIKNKKHKPPSPTHHFPARL